MRRYVIFTAFVLAACSSAADRSHELLMQQIEEGVHLPKGAAKLEKYNRFYAMNGSNVVGIYLRSDLITKQTSAPAFGARWWLNDKRDLPNFSDGGCSIVSVIFNPETHTFKKIFCNGIA